MTDFLIRLLRKIRFVSNTYLLFLNDAWLYTKHSNGLFTNSTQKRALDSLIVYYHPIEKGLCMPELRLGFGKERVMTVIDMINAYCKRWNGREGALLDAVGVIREYDELHKRRGFVLEGKLQKKIDSLLANFDSCPASAQPLYTRQTFFQDVRGDFATFAKSRRSLRNYLQNGSVSRRDIIEAIDLCRTSPSTCNRQSVKVHLVENKELVQSVLAMQSGNRGFGHLADKLLVITSDIQSWNVPGERFSPYLDSGIFAMNLLYALHYYKIGACPLNWSESKSRNKQLHNLLDIPENELITMMISCGMAPDQFKVVRSERKELKDILVEHK